ncbi:MAG TPA: hypothetical protein VGL93_17135 [Streptosporangiaceae bacterium]
MLEGMPGSGKTVITRLMECEGRTVLGEYVTPPGSTVPDVHHPDVADDAAHQRNWNLKADQARRALTANRPVACDRDWLTALAYAFTIAPLDGGQLFERRLAWARHGLDDGSLVTGHAYVLFDLDVATSLRRRAGRLRPAHPWSRPDGLERLAAFYSDPLAALRPYVPTVAARLGAADVRRVSGAGLLASNARIVRDLMDDR